MIDWAHPVLLDNIMKALGGILDGLLRKIGIDLGFMGLVSG